MSLLGWLRGDNEAQQPDAAEDRVPKLVSQSSLCNQRLSEAACQSPNTAADYLPKNFSLYDSQKEGAPNTAVGPDNFAVGPDNVAQPGSAENRAAGRTDIPKSPEKLEHVKNTTEHRWHANPARAVQFGITD